MEAYGVGEMQKLAIIPSDSLPRCLSLQKLFMLALQSIISQQAHEYNLTDTFACACTLLETLSNKQQKVAKVGITRSEDFIVNRSID